MPQPEIARLMVRMKTKALALVRFVTTNKLTQRGGSPGRLAVEFGARTKASIGPEPRAP